MKQTYPHPTRVAVQTRKRNEANARLTARRKLTPTQQLKMLNARPGDAKSERARLKEAIPMSKRLS